MPLKKKLIGSPPSSIEKPTPADTFGFLSDVKAEKIDWLWYPYIAYGMMTILEGDPGLGKTFITMALAASVSTGGKLPSGERVGQGRVLIINGEDDPAYTLRPRIDALDGDASKIRYMANYVAFDEDGLEKLRAEVTTFPPDLIIIDPLFSYIPGTADMFKPNQIRPFLAKLAEVAKLTPSALVLLRHLRKSGGDKQLYAGSGSIDVIAVARSALVVFEDPDDDTQRVLAHLKHNLSPAGPSWLFAIEQANDEQTATIVWKGETELKAADAGGRSSKDDSKLDDAKEFLLKELESGPKPARYIEEKAEKHSHSKRTLARAKSDLAVVATKVKSGWSWSLEKTNNLANGTRNAGRSGDNRRS